MNLESSLDFFINQGPVFWAACASVGTGGTLLIAALYVYMRRLAGRGKIQLRKKETPDLKASIKDAKPEIRVTDTGYALADGSAGLDVHPAPSGVHMADLLQRLRTVGDNLEEALAIPSAAEIPHSALKTRPESVEYVSRVGIG